MLYITEFTFFYTLGHRKIELTSVVVSQTAVDNSSGPSSVFQANLFYARTNKYEMSMSFVPCHFHITSSSKCVRPLSSDFMSE